MGRESELAFRDIHVTSGRWEMWEVPVVMVMVVVILMVMVLGGRQVGRQAGYLGRRGHQAAAGRHSGRRAAQLLCWRSTRQSERIERWSRLRCGAVQCGASASARVAK